MKEKSLLLKSWHIIQWIIVLGTVILNLISVTVGRVGAQPPGAECANRLSRLQFRYYQTDRKTNHKLTRNQPAVHGLKM